MLGAGSAAGRTLMHFTGDDAAAVPLALIGEIASLLESHGIAVWLFGGWAVDFLVGRVTRRHSDIDLAVQLDDGERAVRLLAGRGYLLRHPLEEERAVLTKHGEQVDLYYVTTNHRGEAICPGKWAFWPWPPGSFGDLVGRLGDVTCRVVSLEAQLDGKESYHRHTGTPLRPKDLADIDILRELRPPGGTSDPARPST